MNPEDLFCPNIDCPSRGQVKQGNIGVHHRKEKRAWCEVCRSSFAITKGTLFYRLRTDPKLVVQVIVLLAYGCPLQAVVQAFGFDERTIKTWWERAGVQCRAVHEQVVSSRSLELQHVQADEIKVKVQGGHLWMALAMMVSTRLWLAGVLDAKRDKKMMRQLAEQIRHMALCRPLLLAVDGWRAYVEAFQRAFRSQLPAPGPGRSRLVAWPNIAIVQVVKQRLESELHIERRIVQGCRQQIKHLLQVTQAAAGVINTAYIERLNATFRLRLSWLTRRTRTLAQQPETLQAGMYIVGCFYNLCDFHHSLRLRLSVGRFGYKWVQRTPAMAAALTDHQWTADELLRYRVPPPRWTPPKRRGRPSKELLSVTERWC
jgi:transposase-like protein/IS1 family transposase